MLNHYSKVTNLRDEKNILNYNMQIMKDRL